MRKTDKNAKRIRGPHKAREKDAQCEAAAANKDREWSERIAKEKWREKAAKRLRGSWFEGAEDREPDQIIVCHKKNAQEKKFRFWSGWGRKRPKRKRVHKKAGRTDAARREVSGSAKRAGKNVHLAKEKRIQRDIRWSVGRNSRAELRAEQIIRPSNLGGACGEELLEYIRRLVQASCQPI